MKLIYGKEAEKLLSQGTSCTTPLKPLLVKSTEMKPSERITEIRNTIYSDTFELNIAWIMSVITYLDEQYDSTQEISMPCSKEEADRIINSLEQMPTKTKPALKKKAIAKKAKVVKKVTRKVSTKK